MQNSPFPIIDYEQLDDNIHFIIDVRSPEEYEEFQLPNSINLPLFSNEERKQIGTTYKQKSPAKAKKIGIEIYSQKLPYFYDIWVELVKAHPSKKLVVTCARGGMRSASFVSMMLAMQIPVYQLSGGIRSVRQSVQTQLEHFAKMDWKTIVLGGYTGTGKTKWLRELIKRDYPVLDLEGLANHRGSVFGHIGLERRSQKQFEFKLAEELDKLAKDRVMIIEAESKRIGQIVLPDFIIENKGKGIYLEIHDRMERRVQHIMDDYEPFENAAEIEQSLGKIHKRLPTHIIKEVDMAIHQQQYELLFELLLRHYYDQKYSHKQKGYVEQVDIRHIDLSEYPQEKITSVIQAGIDEILKNFNVVT